MSLKSKIEKIILAIKDTNISEIEITNFWGAQKIKLKTGNCIESSHVYNKSEPTIAKNNKDDVEEFRSDNIETKNSVKIDEKNSINSEDSSANKEYTIIKAPLVGTFYQAAKPGDKPFVDIGSKLNIGDSLCIIEAMKIFNTIESEYDGEIKEIFIQDGEPVEYGQALFSIDIK